jgi:hypothetical protein
MNKFDQFIKKINYSDPTKLKENNIDLDEEIKESIYRINESGWCYTLWCCAGHIKKDAIEIIPYIVFAVDNKFKTRILNHLLETTKFGKRSIKFPLLSNARIELCMGYNDKDYSIITAYWYLNNPKQLKILHEKLNAFSYKVKYEQKNRS